MVSFHHYLYGVIFALSSIFSFDFCWACSVLVDNNLPCHATLDGVCYDLVQGDVIRPRVIQAQPLAIVASVVDKPELYSWTNGLIPYELDSGFSSQQRSWIMDAFAHISEKTCVRFTARTSQRQYVSIKSDRTAGCFSYIGKMSPTYANLGDGCFLRGTIVHELMHAMGFQHEQNRPDRDANVEIKWDSIILKYRYAFAIEPRGVFFGTPYDFASVMHYRTTAFSSNGQPTIVAKRPISVIIGQREGLSTWDRVEINQLYKCPGRKQFFIIGSHNHPDYDVVNNRDQAMAFCEKCGGRPGMMKSDAEFALASRVKDELSSQIKVWVGMKRDSSEADFRWDDGTAVTTAGWARGEPDNSGGNENCTQMSKAFALTEGWSDVSCVNGPAIAALCESFPSLTYFMMIRPIALTRDMAAEECRKVGARMAIIKSQDEYEAAVQVKLDNGIEYAWIGLMRLSNSPQSWRWDDGERLTTTSFSKWSLGEPNNNVGNEFCVQMSSSNLWSDLPCQDNVVKSVICERGRYIS